MNTVIDPWAFYNRNCTSFAAWRLNQQGGRTKAPWSFLNNMVGPNGKSVHFGNAIEWKAAAQKGGWKVDSTPAVGAVAWWGAEVGAYGHVAIVTKVNGDGSALVEEYNYGFAGTYRKDRVVRASSYLHVKDEVTLKNFESAPTPSVSGSFVVDSTITAVPGTWKPTATLKYQWKRDGANISGATKQNYKLAQSDIGKKVSVSVTGSRSGYKTTTKTSAAKVVTAATLPGPHPVPTISGSAKHGSTLTAQPGAWAVGVSLKYQWKRGGSTISGATAKTYKLVEADIGKRLTVTVTGSKLGHKSVAKTSAATAVIASPLGSTLKTGKRLTSNQALYSSNGNYRLRQQTDGNLVLTNLSSKKPIWATNKFASGMTTRMQTDGNLVQYNASNKAVWASNTNGKKANRLVVQNDGNVVLYTAANKAVWATNTVGK
ncbi:CHAP domain-containing protein [Ornithinimicrobium ciconiae]|nr:CHAP domain-containing protein [Ornithinimicrobium ciconiae]